jgi:hypothetical protein
VTVRRRLVPAGLALLLAVGLCALPLAEGRAQGSERGQGPFLLVALPSLGIATWRCSDAPGRYALGFRVFARGASTDIRLVARGRTLRRGMVHPGSAIRLPVQGLEQVLLVEQLTGAGTLRAVVQVRFDREPVVSHCFPYAPPALSVRVTTRG